MEIRINGQTANITLDTEKTIGEIMAGVEQWLGNSGHRLSGLSVDGQAADTSMLDEIFSREIEKVKTLDIFTSSLAELSAESLIKLLADIEEYESLSFEEKNNFLQNWVKRAQAMFAQNHLTDLYNLLVNSFSGGDVNPRTAFSITEERLREVKNPLLELTNLKPLTEEVCARLTDLALDIQTGKDLHAVQTIQIFSGLAEKILRILKQLDLQGYLSQETDDEKSFIKIISEFGDLVNDLLEAYEKKDTVLVGDLAEYEASPKLLELYSSIIKNCGEKDKV